MTPYQIILFILKAIRDSYRAEYPKELRDAQRAAFIERIKKVDPLAGGPTGS